MSALSDCINAALGATRDLRTRLEAGDLVGCAEMLEKRDLVLAEFREVYDGSSGEERTRHRGLLADLVEADEEIRKLAEGRRLDAAAGLASSPRAPKESTEPLNACLDRRA